MKYFELLEKIKDVKIYNFKIADSNNKQIINQCQEFIKIYKAIECNEGQALNSMENYFVLWAIGLCLNNKLEF